MKISIFIITLLGFVQSLSAQNVRVEKAYIGNFDWWNSTPFSTDYYLQDYTSLNNQRDLTTSRYTYWVNGSFESFEEHTGNNGAMLLGKGATNGSRDIWSNSYSVVAGREYELSVWVRATQGTNPPILYWLADGSQVGTSVTTTTNGWQLLKVTYTATTTGFVEFSIRNNETSSSGNTFAIDDISIIEEILPTCSGNFYDTGGPNSNYSHNEDYYQTYCAPYGEKIRFDFTSFRTRDWNDRLIIYDGVDQSANNIGEYASNSGPGTVTSSDNCLTFRFYSNSSRSRSGWEATISCVPDNDCNTLDRIEINDIGGSNDIDISSGATLYTNQLPGSWNINAVVSGPNSDGSNASVFFDVKGDATQSNTENTSVYHLGGDNNPTNWGLGTYNIDVTLYEGNNRSGKVCGNYNVDLIIEDCNLSTFNPSSNTPVCAGSDLNLSSGVAISGASYSWIGPNGFSSSQANPTISNVNTSRTGIYSVTITMSGCSASATTGVNVSQSPSVTATKNNATCGTNDGSIVFSFPDNAGQSGLQFSVNGGSSYPYSSNDNAGSYTANNIAPGNYSLMARWDDSSCPVSLGSQNIIRETGTASISGDLVICSGDQTTLTSTLNNAVGGVTYSWSNGLGSGRNKNVSPNSNTTYTVTATDNEGCSATTTAAVVVNALPSALANSSSPVCNGGSLNLYSNSGFSSYLWTAPNSNTYTTEDLVISGVNSSYAGTYTLEVIDANGCSNTGSTNVTVSTWMVPTASNTGPYCAGQTIALSASGADTYSWSGPSGFTSSGASVTRTSATLGMQGVYTVTATESGTGCSASATTNVTVLSSNISASNTGPVCSGGNVSMSVSGGGSSYSWSGPNSYSSSSSNPVLSNVAAANEGIYTVTSNITPSCPVSATVELTVYTLPNVSALDTIKVCKDDNATLMASGGISYTWVGPNSFNSSETSGNATVSSVNTSKTGIYTVTVTNAAGCTSTATTALVISFPSLSITGNGPVCEGDDIELTANGGVSYSWSGPNSFSSSTPNNTIPSASTSEDGDYVLTVSNSLGCTATSAVTIDVLASNPVITGTSVICEGDSILLDLSSWETHSWTGPNGFTSTSGSPSIANASTSNGGVYSVTVSKLGGCTATATFNVTVNALPNISIAGDNSICKYADLNLTASGALSYLWTGPDGYTSSSSSFTISSIDTLQAGYYKVVATDGNGCVSADSVNVEVNYATVTASGGGTFCYGSNVTLSSTNGSTYEWTGPASFSSASRNATLIGVTELNNGSYTIQLTDSNGCIESDTIDLLISKPNAEISSGTSFCIGEDIALSGSGGVSYTWSGPSGFSSNFQNPIIANSAPWQSGEYILSIVDSAGCTDSDTLQITIHDLPTPTAGNDGPKCQLETLNLTSSGGVSYSWSGQNGFNSSAQNPSIANASPSYSGVYTVTVTDNNSCSQTATTTVTINSLPTVTATSANGNVCVQSNINLSASGGTNYSWTSPDSQTRNGSSYNRSNVTEAMSGIYTVSVTDNNGCVNTGTVNVTVHPFPDPPTADDVTICGAGKATLTASGCAGTISWFSSSSSSTVLGTGETFITPNMNIGDTEDYYVECTIYTCASLTRTKIDVEVLQPPYNLSATDTGEHCVYTSAKLFGSASNAASYSWTGPGSFSSNVQNPVFVTNPNSDGIYTLTVTAANGCTATATTELVVNTNCGGMCSNGIAIEPTNPGSCSSTNGGIRGNDYGAGVYEISIDGINWKRSTYYYGGGSSDGYFGGLGVGSYLFFVRDRTSNIICRTVYITLISNGGSFFSSHSANAASDCFASDGSIVLEDVLPTDEVSWIGYREREYVPISSLSPENTITGLEPGTYYVRVKRYSSQYCYKEEIITVPNSGTPCDISTFCEIGPEGNKFVNGDFGSGSPLQGAPLGEDETSYGYVSPGCNSPNDGFYTIVNTLDCNGSSFGGAIFGTWDVITEDHTPGDTDGYMMVVNASYEPDVVVEQTINDLCPNSRYNFTAWVRNLTANSPGHIDPNFALLIDGVSRYTTGAISASGWHQVGFSFKTSNNTSAIFSIRNNADGGYGNDWIIDDIVVSKCPLVIELEGTTIACLGGENEEINATVEDPLDEFSFYKWQESTDGGVTWTDVSGITEGTFVNHVMDVSLTLPTPIPSYISGIDYQIVLAPDAAGFDNVGCVVTSGLTKLLVPPIEITVTEDQVKCIGSGEVTLEAIPSGGNAPYTFEWDNGLPAVASVNVNPSITTDYIVTARDSSGCPITDTINVAVEDQPTLTVSIGPDSVCIDGLAFITAYVEGGSGDFDFTWFSTYDTTGTWTEIVGEKDSIYHPETSAAHQIYYRVFVEDLTFDCNDALSNAVLFNVVDDPLISLNATDISLCLNGDIELVPTITGGTGEYQYQWQYSSDGNAPWADLPSDTTVTLDVPSDIVKVEYYRLTTIPDGNGCNAPPSDVARVEVLPEFDVDVSLIDNVVCIDGLVVLHADTSSGSGTVTYQWSNSSDGSNFTAITGATDSTYSPVTSSEGLMYYQVDATASGIGCGTATSDNATVTVLPEFSVDVAVNNSLVCIGGAAELVADTTNGTGTVTYQWFESTDDVSFSPISGATDSNYVASTATEGITYYRVEATADGSGCGTVVSASVSVEVLPVFSVEIAVSSDVVCVGGTVKILADTTNGTGTVTYQWFESDDNSVFTPISGETDSLLNVNTAVVGTRYYYVEATASGSGCGTVRSATGTVEVLPVFEVDASLLSNTVCIGGEVLLITDTTSGTGTVTYQWFSSTDGSSFDPVTDSTRNAFVPVTSSEGVIYYQVQATSSGEGCGTAISDDVTVTVLPIFDVDVSVNNSLVCIGGAVQLEADTVNGTGTVTYQWLSSTDNSTFSAISGATDSVYVPNTSSEGIIYYQVQATASGSGCGTVTSASASVEVLPVFSVDIALANHTVCVGGNVNLVADTTNGTGTVTYQWFESSDNSVFTLMSGETDSSLTVNTSSEGITYYYIEATASGSGCGTVRSATATVEVLPVFTVDVALDNNIVCQNGLVQLSSDTTSGTGTVTYQWFSSSDGSSFNPITDSTKATLIPSTTAVDTLYYRLEATASGVGCGTAVSDIASVAVLPQLSIDILPGNAEVCLGTPVTFEGKPQNGVGNITYQWQAFNGVTWQNINSETDSVYSPSTAVAGQYQYRINSFADGVGCTDASSAPAILIVNDFPDVTVSNVDPLCIPNNGQVAFSFSNEPYQDTIQFSIDGGLTYPYFTYDSLSTYSIDTLSAGTYHIFARWGDNSCPIDLGNVDLDERPAPTATVTYLDPTCTTDNGQITFTFPDEATRTQIEFSLDGGVTYETAVNDNAGSVSYSGLAPATYDLWVRWENDECPIDLSDVTLTDHPGPVLTVSADTTICFGSTALLTASSTGGDAPIVYSWNNGLPDGSSHTVSPTDDASFIVVATDSNGCASEDTILITVNPLPVISMTGGEYCEGDTIFLTVTGGQTYEWSGPNGFSSTTQDPSIANSDTTNGGVYTVNVVDLNSCQTIDSVKVIVNPAPEAPNVTNADRCGPGVLTLTASGCSGTTTWFDNQFSSSIVGFGTTFETKSLVASANYFASCTSTSSCESFDRALAVAEIRETSNAEVIKVNSTCVGEVPLNNGILIASGFREGETYSFSEGSTFDASTAIPATPAVIPSNGRMYETIDNPSGFTTYYTVRIISTDGCPVDHTVEFERQCDDCLPFCEPASISKVK